MSAWTISLRKGADRPFSLRVWMLAAVACGALAAPALARAASPAPGMPDVTATVNAAFAQVGAVAPQVASTTQPAVDQALAAVSGASELATAQTAAAAAATQSAPVAPPPGPAAAPSPAGVVSNAVAPVLAAAGVPSAAPVPASAKETRPAPPRGNRSPVSSDTAAARPPTRAGGYPAAVLGTGASPIAAALAAPRMPAQPSAHARSSQRARSSETAPAGAYAPNPVPPGPTSDLTSPAQAGGTGSFAPLLVAALAAALMLASFPFSSRLLPQLAFRKPRWVLLAVWHPG